MADTGQTGAATGKSKRKQDMAIGNKAFAIAALMALVAISGSQGQARGDDTAAFTVIVPAR